jgi:chitinase
MSIPRTSALLTAALPVVAGAALFGATQFANAVTPAAGAAFPAHFAAPYLQIGNDDTGDMAGDMNATGLKYYTLAFLIPQSGCTPQWEDGNESLGAFTSQVSSLQAAGGNVMISFGGASGGEIAQTCTSTSSLTAAYANVASTYGVNRLDFDIEGGVLGDTASNTRRNAALAALQAQHPNIQVDFTIAVNPDGLPGDELSMLQQAKNDGVHVGVVNIMTMDFGDGQNALADAESAAQATAGQLAGLYGISTAQAYGMLGLTPIAGQNDDNEYFSQSDASALEQFAAGNGVAELSFWEVDGYDKGTGYAYSRIFDTITGGSGGGGQPTGQITGYGGKCVDVAGANPANGTQVQLYTCNGTGAQQWTVASNGTVQALGKCLDVAGAGTANGTKVQLYDCNGTGAQQWTHTSANQLVNPESGRCLDATGPSSADGTPLQIWDCTGAANQSWNLP